MKADFPERGKDMDCIHLTLGMVQRRPSVKMATTVKRRTFLDQLSNY